MDWTGCVILYVSKHVWLIFQKKKNFYISEYSYIIEKGKFISMRVFALRSAMIAYHLFF